MMIIEELALAILFALLAGLLMWKLFNRPWFFRMLAGLGFGDRSVEETVKRAKTVEEEIEERRLELEAAQKSAEEKKRILDELSKKEPKS